MLAGCVVRGLLMGRWRARALRTETLAMKGLLLNCMKKKVVCLDNLLGSPWVLLTSTWRFAGGRCPAHQARTGTQREVLRVLACLRTVPSI